MASRHLLGFASSGIRLARRRQYWGHDGLISAFAESVRGDGISPVPIENALSVVRCADDIVEAITSG